MSGSAWAKRRKLKLASHHEVDQARYINRLRSSWQPNPIPPTERNARLVSRWCSCPSCARWRRFISTYSNAKQTPGAGTSTLKRNSLVLDAIAECHVR